MMIFFLVLLFTNKSLLYVSIIAIFICFSIEFSQLLEYDSLLNMRNSYIGWILLWKGFLVSDLIAYSVWIIMSYYMNWYVKIINYTDILGANKVFSK